jgi:hypothetical protein
VLVTVGPVGARRVVPCGACWADVYDNNHEEMQACEATWTPGRGAGVRKGVGFKSPFDTPGTSSFLPFGPHRHRSDFRPPSNLRAIANPQGSSIC